MRQIAAAEPGGKLPHTIGLVVGTRPEAIKLAPVARALARAGAVPHLYLTGQHPGLDPVEHGLGRVPTTRLEVAGRPDPLDHVEEVSDALARRWHGAPPALVLVQGDTSSALGGARAALRCRAALGHVEAGLRSFDPRSPWPEEQFRCEIDRDSDLLFAPTPTAAANLRREACHGAVHVTGNSGIDALRDLVATLPAMKRRTARRGAPLRLLVTCHRRENWGAGLASLAAALRTLARTARVEVEVVLHPNPQVAETMWALLVDEPGIRLSPPLSHRAMVERMRRSDLILSDSGGVQEEAPALGIPLLVLRDKTERPECLACGSALLVGTDADELVGAVRRLVEFPEARAAMAIPRFPFGDGQAAPRIAALSLAWLDARGIDDHKASALTA